MINFQEQPQISIKEEFCEDNIIQSAFSVPIQRDIPKGHNPYFCCKAHEALFSEDFESDEEDVSFLIDKNPYTELYFHEKIPESIKIEIAHMKNKNNAATQCNTGAPVSLSHISLLACTGGPNDKMITANYRPKSINHTPVMYLPNEIVDMSDEIQHTFLCKCCRKEFKSGQALGGHVSRAHPGFVEEQARKLRDLKYE